MQHWLRRSHGKHRQRNRVRSGDIQKKRVAR
jgi:hypothetical protein